MKSALVVFSRNAGDSLWPLILKSYSEQEKVIDTAILVDTESSDRTVEYALEHKWQIRRESIATFNHGGTRQKMVEELSEKGYEAAIFATQDVLPATPGTLKTLVENLKETHAAVAYARQIPRSGKTFDGYFRTRNYPELSRVKTKEDIKELGLMTPFCSNSLAVWDIKKVMAAGGFPETVFGEDMLMGAKLIAAGEKISYCAESCCIHEHPTTLRSNFKRGMDIGRLHGAYPMLQKQFGKAEACAAKRFSPGEMCRFFLPLAVKYCGYAAGFFMTAMKKK